MDIVINLSHNGGAIEVILPPPETQINAHYSEIAKRPTLLGQSFPTSQAAGHVLRETSKLLTSDKSKTHEQPSGICLMSILKVV
jgi:hypothetical protein